EVFLLMPFRSVFELRALPRSALTLQNLGNRQHQFLLPRLRCDLDADRASFSRLSDWHHGPRHSQDVEPLAVAPRVEVVDGLAFDLPTALAMPKCGDR